MSQKIDVPLFEDVVIGDGWSVVWDAVDPTTGASVSGVKISLANVVASDVSLGDGTGVGAVGPYMLVPGPDA